MKRLLVLTAFLVLLPRVANAACPCPQKSVSEKYGDASAVFQGTMKSVEEIPGDVRTERVTFTLEQSWKGTAAPEQDVVFPVSVDACGLPQEEIGKSYLVYARATPAQGGALESSMCDGTDLRDMLPSDIRFLDAMYHPNTPYPLLTFPDVPAAHPSSQAIREFREKEIISGFPDGTFRPDWPVSRAEMTKILSKVTLPYDHDRQPETYAFTDTALPFRDLERTAWYNLYVRRAFRAGIVQGFADGTFRPAKNVTVAEAFAMIARAMHVDARDESGAWYARYVRALADRHAIPTDINDLTAPMTRAQVVEILWRLQSDIETRDSLAADDLLAKTCVPAEDASIPGVDMRRVRSAWLALYNDVRRARGLAPYRLDSQLSRTAAIWSKRSADRGVMEHKRDGTTAYYDYSAIEAWFKNLGLTFANRHSMTFTENIGRGPYRCTAADCTDGLIAAIRSTFDFYLAEEPKEYRPHFRAIVNPEFRLMGLGLAVKDGQYYLTAHFATEITSSPAAICSPSM